MRNSGSLSVKRRKKEGCEKERKKEERNGYALSARQN